VSWKGGVKVGTSIAEEPFWISSVVIEAAALKGDVVLSSADVDSASGGILAGREEGFEDISPSRHSSTRRKLVSLESVARKDAHTSSNIKSYRLATWGRCSESDIDLAALSFLTEACLTIW